MTFWNRVYCLLGLWSPSPSIYYTGFMQLHFASTLFWTLSAQNPYPIPDLLLSTCMNQNLLSSSQVIKFPEVIPYNFQTKCFKTLTFEQHSLPSTCIFISFSMSPTAGQLCTKIHTR